MKSLLVLSGCVLLVLRTLAASENDIKVEDVYDGIKLSCEKENTILKRSEHSIPDGYLSYNDDNSGEYACVYNGTDDKNPGKNETKIYVKFRTCDNCIELDIISLLVLIVGNVVATIVIGVSVYLVASSARAAGPTTSHPKSSDIHLGPNEASTIGPSNDPYQELQFKGRVETYDFIQTGNRIE